MTKRAQRRGKSGSRFCNAGSLYTRNIPVQENEYKLSVQNKKKSEKHYEKKSHSKKLTNTINITKKIHKK